MKVLSTNYGVPATYEFNGLTMQTSMRRKENPNGIRIFFDRVEGDQFAAPKVHGIREQVVYALASDFFPEFAQLLKCEVEAGNFGENLTIDQLDEREIFVGDIFEVGTVRLKVGSPRAPCNRLNFSFQRVEAQNTFIQLSRPGVYFEVLKEGEVQPGDVLKLEKSSGSKVSIADVFTLWKLQKEFAAGRKRTEVERLMFVEAQTEVHIPEYIRTKLKKGADPAQFV